MTRARDDVKLDRYGKWRKRPGERAERYYTLLYGHPEWAGAHYRAALELCRQEGTDITKEHASGTARFWDSNPWREEIVAMLFRREEVKPMARRAADWLADLRREQARAEEKDELMPWLAGLKTEADYMPPDGMPKRDTGDKPPIQLNITLLWGGSNEALRPPAVVDAESVKVE